MDYEKLLEQQNEELKLKLAVSEQQLAFTRMFLKHKLQYQYRIVLETYDLTSGDYLHDSAIVDRDDFKEAYCMMRACKDFSQMKTIINIYTPLRYKVDRTDKYIFTLSFMITALPRKEFDNIMFIKKYSAHNHDEAPVMYKLEYQSDGAISCWALKV